MDITMCSGLHCPIAKKCFRKLAKKSEYQSWFCEVPYDFELGECEYFYKADFR